jgi:hypothetical protein
MLPLHVASLHGMVAACAVLLEEFCVIDATVSVCILQWLTDDEFHIAY